MKNATTRVYCAGGAGTNIGLAINSPYLSTCYIDTSMSNRTKDVSDDLCHYIKGLDGSGKNRRQNYAVITKEIPEILSRFEAADFNIVVFSAAGGSGSVIGPLLLKALLEQNAAVMALVIGSDDSAISVTNTRNTLKSLEAISTQARQPIVISYHQNTPGVRRASVDEDVLFTLESIGELTCQDNEELDTADITNFVQYHRVCPVQPQLSALRVFTERQLANTMVEPIAIASLYTDRGDESAFGNPHYNTVGFPRERPLPFSNQLHFVINIAEIADTDHRLSDREIELNKQFSAYRQRKSVVNADDNIQDDGMVL